jgi:hypothetical protein
MSSFSTIILVPFILAFLVFVVRFYVRESAGSMRNLSFVLAVVSMLTAGAYLLLRVTEALPPYGTLGFGIIGLALLAAAIARMFTL